VLVTGVQTCALPIYENQARKEFFDSLKINNGGHQI
jgi:hypothetical protein